MDNSWDKIFDGLDWDAVDRDIKKLEKEEADSLSDFVWQPSLDSCRGYVRKILRAHPELTDHFKIEMAAGTMEEAHDGGVEMEVDDALRFVENDRPKSVADYVNSLLESGISESDFMDILEKDVSDDYYGTVRNPKAVRKARLMTRYVDMLTKNPDVIALGIPVFDHHADWTQAKLAFFSENLNAGERAAVNELKKLAETTHLSVENGIAVAVFQIGDIWAEHI